MATRQVRHKRTTSKLVNSKLPRLSVFRSQKHVYAQIIDDTEEKTLVAIHSKSITKKATKTDLAKEVGKELAKLALTKSINQVVFDRGGYLYHGRVAAVAEGAREGGLQF